MRKCSLPFFLALEEESADSVFCDLSDEPDEFAVASGVLAAAGSLESGFPEDAAESDEADPTGLGGVAVALPAELSGGVSVAAALGLGLAGFEASGSGSTAMFEPGLAFGP